VDRRQSSPCALFQRRSCFCDERRKQKDEDSHISHMRALCHAAVDCGHLKLSVLTGIENPEYIESRERAIQSADGNNLAATVDLRMRPSVQRQLSMPGATNGISYSYFGHPLSCAATIGDGGLMRTLLASDLYKNQWYWAWTWAWAAAAKDGHLKVLRLLLKGNKPDLGYHHYLDALRHASRGNHIKMIRFLFKNAKMLHHQKGDYQKGDHQKGDHQKGDHQKGDHQKGDHQKGIDQKGNNSLPEFTWCGGESKAEKHWLEEILLHGYLKGYANVVRFALRRGPPSPSSKSRYPRDFLALASHNGHFQVTSLLLQNYPKIRRLANFSDHVTHALACAAGGGWISVSKLLLDQVADIYPVYYKPKSTPWVRAARGGHAELLQLFLSRGLKLRADDGLLREMIEDARRIDYTTITNMLIAVLSDIIPSHFDFHRLMMLQQRPNRFKIDFIIQNQEFLTSSHRFI
jgi:hypothetical protein